MAAAADGANLLQVGVVESLTIERSRHRVIPSHHDPQRLGSPTAIAAPMVQQSDLAFRALVRLYGCGLAYTQVSLSWCSFGFGGWTDGSPTITAKSNQPLLAMQMFHAGHFADVAVYRAENWDGLDSYGEEGAGDVVDRPLIAQFAGDEPETLVRAAAHVEGRVDAVDLNLGCPQVRLRVRTSKSRSPRPFTDQHPLTASAHSTHNSP